jgi:type 2 lantibiotic biosynthesis protein LanM
MTAIEERRVRSIAERATPMWDRALNVTCLARAADLKKARDRLDRWQKILGGADALNRRLQGRDLRSRQLALLSGGQQHSGQQCLPSWASTLASVLPFCSSSPEGDKLSDTDDRSYDRTRPLPFQEVLVGFVRLGREQLKAQAGSVIDVLSPRAVAALERQLLAHLTFVASLTLGRHFYEFRFEHAPASAVEALWCRQRLTREIYEGYVRHMHGGGLIELFDTYPVLARLLSQSVEQWMSTSVKLCQRFFHDFSDLRTFFGWRVERLEGAVEHLRTDLSDRHREGQNVTECVLRTGERVVYKPRTVQAEVVFYDLIGWLNDCGLSLALRDLRALDRGSYGWVESIASAQCNSNAAVDRFYSRAGMLLAILHALGTTDIHCENLIACGEHPVVVDLETLMSEGTSKLRGSLKRGLGTDASGRESSVLSTGLLPRWQTAPDGHRFDMSALGADETQDAGIGRLEWQSINTDQMTLSEVAAFAVSTAHRARLGDRLTSVLDHLPTFLMGFQEMYSCLLAHRHRLLTDDQLLRKFDNLELRVLLRGTATYTRLQLRLLHPEFLRDGIDRSIELEWLARPLTGPMSAREARILVYERERTAMESLDVPHFGTSEWRSMEHMSDDPDLLLLSGERDSRVLRQRLENLSSPDCTKQLAIIEEAVRSRFGRALA